jgi:hypothetical protein
VYDFLFERYRNKKVTFVEIGVLGGGSLFMWRKFLGEEARIIGVDLNPKAKKWENHGFEIYIGSQSDETFWKEFIDKVGKIDIVLDDGGHTYDQQIITVENLIPFVNDDGMIVVEDTHTSYMDGFGPRSHSFINYSKILIDKLNYRFSSFDGRKFDTRFWSLQFFESFLVIFVNSKITSVKSYPVQNNGINDNAEDFRYKSNRIFSFIEENVKNFIFLKNIPVVGKIAIIIRRYIGRLTYDISKIKKYFK